MKPLANRVTIKPDEAETTTKTGIVLTESSQEKPLTGTVLEIGPDVQELKKGDKIMYSKYGATEVKIDGKTLLVTKEEDVLAKLC